jgi:hypothetical protein
MKSRTTDLIRIYKNNRNKILEMGDKLENLAIGSSHGQYAFNSNLIKNTHNLCTSSQDLKYSFLLYEKCIDECKNLKNIIVFYSIFSAGSELEKSKTEVPHAIALNCAFDLNVQYENQDVRDLAEEMAKIPDDKNSITDDAGFPPEQIYFFPNEYGALKRATDHLRFNQKTDALGYLFQIIALAKKFNHKLFFVLPPYRNDYKKSLESLGADRFFGLSHALKMVHSFYNPIVIDFYNSTAIFDADFGDFDHLNPFGDGPRKLTSLIANNIDLDPKNLTI